jgi:hypothetical protein
MVESEVSLDEDDSLLDELTLEDEELLLEDELMELLDEDELDELTLEDEDEDEELEEEDSPKDVSLEAMTLFELAELLDEISLLEEFTLHAASKTRKMVKNAIFFIKLSPYMRPV